MIFIQILYILLSSIIIIYASFAAFVRAHEATIDRYYDDMNKMSATQHKNKLETRQMSIRIL